MHRLLADDGCLYLHLDWRAVHYARLLLDEIFGAQQILNEIISVCGPRRCGPTSTASTIHCWPTAKGAATCSTRIRCASPTTIPLGARSPHPPAPGLGVARILTAARCRKTGGTSRSSHGCTPNARVIRRRSPRRCSSAFCAPPANRAIGLGISTADRERRCGWRKPSAAGGSARTWPQALQVCQRRLTLAHSRGYAVEQACNPLTPAATLAAAGPKGAVLRVRSDVDGAQVRLQLEGMSVCEPQGFPVSLDYWEADFDHQAPVFRSTAQAARPWRRGLAPLSLSHRYSQPGMHHARVRAVSAAGETAEVDISIEV